MAIFGLVYHIFNALSCFSSIFHIKFFTVSLCVSTNINMEKNRCNTCFSFPRQTATIHEHLRPPPKAPPPKKLRTYSITKQLSRCPAKKTKIRTYVLILGWPCGLARAFNYVAVIRQYVLILERSKNEICPYFGIFLEACKSFRIFLIVGHNKTICSYFGRVQQWEVKQVVFHQTLIGWSA